MEEKGSPTATLAGARVSSGSRRRRDLGGLSGWRGGAHSGGNRDPELRQRGGVIWDGWDREGDFAVVDGEVALDAPNRFRHLLDGVARREVGDVRLGSDVVEPHVDLEHHVEDVERADDGQRERRRSALSPRRAFTAELPVLGMIVSGP